MGALCRVQGSGGLSALVGVVDSAWASSRNASRRAIPNRMDPMSNFIRVLKAETARPPAPTAPRNNNASAGSCVEYDRRRPHEALADQTVPSHVSITLVALSTGARGPVYGTVD